MRITSSLPRIILVLFINRLLVAALSPCRFAGSKPRSLRRPLSRLCERNSESPTSSMQGEGEEGGKEDEEEKIKDDHAGLAQFGEVVRLRDKEETETSSPQFGTVVRLNRDSASNQTSVFLTDDDTSLIPSSISTIESRRKQNIVVAVASIVLAVCNYFWQFTHPISAIQLLYTMEQSSAPITSIASNGKPTVVDFWAPWCENCKQMAPTLYQIEQEYSSQVNFVMVNADTPGAWPLIEAFGVDAIPHLALIEADGTVETALIGSVPKSWVGDDLKVLIQNSDSTTTKQISLPYQMLDTFANRPEGRRIKIVPKEY